MSLVPYGISPKKATDAMDTASPAAQKQPRIKGIEASAGPFLLEDGDTIILDHAMIVDWDHACQTFDTLRLAAVKGVCVLHMTRPGTYITKNPASSFLLPMLATLKDETEKEQVLIVRAQGNIYGGNENALDDTIYFRVLHGKSHEPKTAVWVNRKMIKSFDGPPTNDLGGRRWKSHASAYLGKDSQTRFLALETVAKVEAY